MRDRRKVTTFGKPVGLVMNMVTVPVNKPILRKLPAKSREVR